MNTTAPRWQKVFADLWGSRARSILVVSSIAVGLFAIGIITTIYAVIAQDMRTSYTAINAANIYIQAVPFDSDMVNSLRDVPGVRQVEGVRVLDLRVRDRDNAWTAVRLQAVADWRQMPINQMTLMAGIWPPGKDEVVVDQYKFRDLGKKLGDSVEIELADGTTRTLRLVGVVQDLTVGAFSGGGGFFHAPVMGYITQDSLDKLDEGDPYSFNGLYATVSGSGADLAGIREVATRIGKVINDNGGEVLASKAVSSYDHPNGYLVDAIVGVLFVLGLLVVFLSGFLITSTLQSLLSQQVLQIGIMKSVGARRIQIVGIYMMMILVLGSLAFIIAAPAANLLSFALLNLLAGQLNFVLQGQRIVWPAVLGQAALALIMPQLAAWGPIWQGTSISVQEALSGIRSGEGQRKNKRKDSAAKPIPAATPMPATNMPAAIMPTEASVPIAGGSTGEEDLVGVAPAVRPAKKRISRPMLIAVRNTFRRKGRLALTLTTLTLGGAIFIATFNVQVSMSKYVQQIAQYFLADVQVSLDQPYRISKIDELISSVPGVGHVEGWASARSELVQADGSAGDRVELLAPPPESKLIKPILIEGRWIQPGDTNAITLGELFRERYPNLHVGDTLRLQVNGKKTDWVVVGFFRLAGKNGGYSAYTSFDYLSGLAGQSNRAVSFQVEANRPHLSPAEQDKLAQAIQAKLNDAGIQISDLTTGSYLTGIAGSGFNILIYFLLFMAVLTAMVGSIGLTGTMSMNVLERTREIGVMRAIGASDRILMRMVLLEGLIIGAISYVLGALLAFPISKLMSDGISLAIFDAPSSFGFTPTGYIIWLGVVILLSFLASMLPARNASRLTIREVLAYE